MIKKYLYNFFNVKFEKLPPKKNLFLHSGSTYSFNELTTRKYNFYFICFGEKNESLYWLRDWLSSFVSMRIQFLVVVRSEELLNWIDENYPSVDVVTVNGFQAIVDLKKNTPATALALYPITSMYNHMFVRLTDVKHIFIGHGDSDKLASAHKVLRMFDEIWCAGQAQIDRMLNQNFNCSSLVFRKVGRPGLRNLLLGKKITSSNSILYLPTWEGSDERWDYGSSHMLDDIITSVTNFKNKTLDIRLHPFIGRRIKKLKNIIETAKGNLSYKDRVRFLGSESLLNSIMGEYDFFICDISSVITECLPLNRPIFLFLPEKENIETAHSKVKLESFCYTYSSLEELHQQLNIVVGGNDYKAENRKSAIDYFIGVEETLNKGFEKNILN